MKYYLILFFVFLFSCKKHRNIVFVIQPLGNIETKLVDTTYKELMKINSNTILNKAIQLPQHSYTAERNRYRADTIIRFLKNKFGADTIAIGLTIKDISTTKDGIKDWGVMGLGYRPGKACVISSFRLDKENLDNQFYKVVFHELGHTLGLPHCKNKTCLMRDAEGGNPLNQEKEFCKKCIRVITNFKN